MTDPETIRKAILEENLSGWLFFNFRHRDPVADLVLGTDPGSMNSRGWFYIILPGRENLKIVHSVESRALDNLSGETVIYTSREELRHCLSSLKGMRLAAQKDNNLTALSLLDGGTAELIQECGITLVSSASLIARTAGVNDADRIKSHEEAASDLYRIIGSSWEYICGKMKKNGTVTESEVQETIISAFRNCGLQTEHPPLVAFGKNTSDPHYETGLKKTLLNAGDIVQFDIWARKPGGMYADISWVGFAAGSAPAEITRHFRAITAARDAVVEYIGKTISEGGIATGYGADRTARSYLERLGYGKEIKHRTGHSIDIELHGYGTNLDSVEFPDNRPFRSGSCFSVEPGIYLSSYGMRTEINCYISGNRLTVSGSSPQKEILLVS